MDTLRTGSSPLDIAIEGQPAVRAGLERNLRVVAAGGGVTFGAKLFLNALRLLTAVWLARLLGAEQFGLYNLALSALSLSMGLALFGMDSAVIRYTAVQAARKDDDAVWQTLQVGFGIPLLLSAFLGTLLFALAEPAAVYVFHEPRLTPLLRLASAFVPLLVANDMLGNALKGFKKIELSALAMFIIQPVTRLAAVAAAALVGMNASWAVATYGLASLTASAAMFHYLRRRFPLDRPFGFSRQTLREITGFAFPVWLSSLMGKFQTNIQSIFLGSLGTMAGVGIFGVASQITMVSGEFSSSINTSSKPVIAELHDRGDLAQMSRIYQATNKWVVMAQLPIFLLIVLLPAPILSIFGESYAGGVNALILLAAADLMNTATGMGGIIIDMAGYTRLKLANSTIRLVLYIVLDLLLIPRWGIAGAAAAVLIGEGAVNLLRMFQVYSLFRMLPFNRSFAKPLLAALAGLAVLLGVRWLLPVENVWLFTGLQGGALVLAYAAALLALGFSEEEKTMLAQLARRVRRMKGGRRG